MASRHQGFAKSNTSPCMTSLLQGRFGSGRCPTFLDPWTAVEGCSTLHHVARETVTSEMRRVYTLISLYLL